MRSGSTAKGRTANTVVNVVIKIEQSFVKRYARYHRIVQNLFMTLERMILMLEYGQPMHAFDVRKIEGEKIIIETAKKGEKFVTLDNTKGRAQPYQN